MHTKRIQALSLQDISNFAICFLVDFVENGQYFNSDS